MKRKIVAGTVAAVAVGGAGAGVAATQFNSSPSQESKAVLSDAASRLGVKPSELSSALKKALEDRVDAAVAAGRLTKAQGDELRQRIESNDLPFFPAPGLLGPGFEHGPHMHGIGVAASYLGLTEAQLFRQLDAGKTLAQVAKDQGKSVDGLVAALKADLKSKLDDAVSAGRLTKAQEDQILKDADQRISDFVNGKLLRKPPMMFDRGFGERHGFDDGPHAAFPGGFE
jgi:uncharacterized protein YidB (DUF937 family)